MHYLLDQYCNSHMVNPDEPGAAVLPPVEKIHQCSRAIAKAVAQSVIDQGLNFTFFAFDAIRPKPKPGYINALFA
jgi:hypothetical protein